MAALVLLLAGCQGGDAQDRGEPGDPRNAGSTAPARPTTLSDLLGISGSKADIARHVRETDRARQELIAACMRKQGFRYVVHVTAGEIVSTTGLPTDLSEEEFRQQHGYGIATGFEASLTRVPRSAQPDEGRDPNAVIVAQMSPSERAAYERALHGDIAPGEPPKGCEGDALKATNRAGQLIEAFGDEVTEMWARVDADPRVVAAKQGWSSCMQRAGHPYRDENAIQADLYRRLNPINSEVIGEKLPIGTMAGRPGLTLTPDQKRRLGELRDLEIAIGRADQACREEMDAVRQRVRDEYEARFVDEHRGRLQELFPEARIG